MKHKIQTLFFILVIFFAFLLTAQNKTDDSASLHEKYQQLETEAMKKEEPAKTEEPEKKEPEIQVEKPVEKKVPAEPEKEKKEPQKQKTKYVCAAVMANVTVPTGKADATWAIHGKLHYIFPFWNPHLSIGAEAGYYTLKGKGTNLDPQSGLYDYSWKIDTVPLFIGLELDYPIIPNLLFFHAGGGFAAVFAWSEGSSFGGKSSAKDVAYGWYAGLGADLRFGIFGGITFEARYTGMLLDFEYPQFNKENGDIGGLSFLLGYKYIF
jgi:hypothetical protein